MGAEKVNASVEPTKIDAADKRKSVTLGDKTYALAFDVVIYQVNDLGDYEIYGGRILPDTGTYRIQLFDTDSSKEGYEYAIVSVVYNYK